MNILDELITRRKKLDDAIRALSALDTRDLDVRKVELIPTSARQALSNLAAQAQEVTPAASKPKKKKKKPTNRLSPEGRKKIVEAQQRRHEEERKKRQQAGGQESPPTVDAPPGAENSTNADPHVGGSLVADDNRQIA